jgi:hypothetical protein
MKLTLEDIRLPAAIILAVIIIATVIQAALINESPSPNNKPNPNTQSTPVTTKTIEKASDPTVRFGFIQKLEANNGTYSIVFDEAEFISNDSSTSTHAGPADLAAIEDGKCEANTDTAQRSFCAPNGFYIRNNSASTTIFDLDPKARIEVLAQSEKEGVHPVRLSLANFVIDFNNPTLDTSFLPLKYYALKEGPYIIKLNKTGRITSLESRYIP